MRGLAHPSGRPAFVRFDLLLRFVPPFVSPSVTLFFRAVYTNSFCLGFVGGTVGGAVMGAFAQVGPHRPRFLRTIEGKEGGGRLRDQSKVVRYVRQTTSSQGTIS